MDSTREELRERLRVVAGSYTHEITKESQREARELIQQLQRCKCRECGKEYNESKARGDYKGFCSAKCQHLKAKRLGYRKGKGSSEFDVLKRHGEVGSVYIVS